MLDIPALNSRIQSVTVFRQGAMVTRTADLQVSGGQYPAQVRLTGLPLSLEDGSIKARVECSTAGAPIACDLRVALEISTPDSDLPPADDEALQAANKERAKLHDRIAHLQRSIERLEELALPPRPRGDKGAPPAPSPTASRLALLHFRREQLQRLIDERLETEQQLKRAHELCQDLESKKAAASNARRPRESELRKSIIVSLRAGEHAAAAATLIIEYMVPGARWAPAYAMQFNRELTRTTLSIRAMICQRSGEDWKEAQLTLSTAQAQSWTELPELNSLRIGKFQPAQHKTGWRPPPIGTDELYAEFDSAFAPIEQEFSKSRKIRALSEITVGGGLAGHRKTDDERERGEVSAEVYLDEMSLASASEVMPMLPPASPPPPPSPAPANAPAMSRVRAAVGSSHYLGADARGGGPADSGMAKRRMAPAQEPLNRIAPAAAESVTLTADEHLLQYGKLRMTAADARGRGKLHPATFREHYLEMISSTHVQINFDVFSVISVAIQNASAIPQPPGRSYLFPSTVEGFDYAYRAETPLSIPSDGQYHSLPLCAKEAAANPRFVTVPREIQDVFRFAEMTNPLDAPLLTGPVDIYVGGDFLMTSTLNMVPPHGVLRMGLGVEQAIKISRNTRFAEETAGLIGGSLNLKHEIAIEVVNQMNLPATVEVRERIPVPREGDDQVKVVAQAAPPWEKFEPDGEDLKGGHRWTVIVPPGKNKQLRADYTVQLASKHEITGGNRREG